MGHSNSLGMFYNCAHNCELLLAEIRECHMGEWNQTAVRFTQLTERPHWQEGMKFEQNSGLQSVYEAPEVKRKWSLWAASRCWKSVLSTESSEGSWVHSVLLSCPLLVPILVMLSAAHTWTHDMFSFFWSVSLPQAIPWLLPCSKKSVLNAWLVNMLENLHWPPK